MIDYLLNGVLKDYQVETENSSNLYCYGTKQDCWNTIQYGAKQGAFGKPKTNLTHIVLMPTLKKILNSNNLDFLSINTTHLKIPLPLIRYLDPVKLPKLKNLTVYNEWAYMDDFKLTDIRLDSGFDLSSFIYLSIDIQEEFEIFGSDRGINLQNYKSLEYLSIGVQGSLRMKRYLKSLQQIKYCSLGTTTNCEDILDYMPTKNLKYLDLAGNEREIDLTKTPKLKDINYLSIRSSKSTFDCEYLKNFTGLKGLSLFDIDKVINIECLLDITDLFSLDILFCGKVFNKKQLEMFKKHGFSHLNINNKG